MCKQLSTGFRDVGAEAVLTLDGGFASTPMPTVQDQGEDSDTTPSSPMAPPRRILATYCDDRLSHIRISFWAKVPVTDAFAASAISLYLQTDQPILGIFDADLFLRDLIAQRSLFCSPLLVNALLYWACVSTSIFKSPVSINNGNSKLMPLLSHRQLP